MVKHLAGKWQNQGHNYTHAVCILNVVHVASHKRCMRKAGVAEA